MCGCKLSEHYLLLVTSTSKWKLGGKSCHFDVTCNIIGTGKISRFSAYVNFASNTFDSPGFKKSMPKYSQIIHQCTKRYWEKRLEEHTHISALTGGPLSGLQIYAPHQHVRTAKCSPSARVHREDFEFIGRESNNYLLQVKESIFIYKHKPVLNGDQRSVPLYLFT